MLEVKEIVNTTNQKEFISKDYLRIRAMRHINLCAEDLITNIAHGEESLIIEQAYSSFIGRISTLANLDILTYAERGEFVATLIECMYDDASICNICAPQFTPCGKVFRKSFKEREV